MIQLPVTAQLSILDTQDVELQLIGEVAPVSSNASPEKWQNS